MVIISITIPVMVQLGEEVMIFIPTWQAVHIATSGMIMYVAQEAMVAALVRVICVELTIQR
jgi:hypothetical protein